MAANGYTATGARSMPAGSRRYVITELRAKHQEVVRLLAMGLKNTEIAEQLGCTAQSISIIANSPVAQARVSELQAERDESVVDVRNQIRSLAPRAIELYREVLEGEHIDIKQRLHAADQILDRGGVPRETSAKIEAAVSHHITEDSLALIKERAIEIARRNHLLIDVTPSEAQTHEEDVHPNRSVASPEPACAGVGC